MAHDIVFHYGVGQFPLSGQLPSLVATGELKWFMAM